MKIKKLSYCLIAFCLGISSLSFAEEEQKLMIKGFVNDEVSILTAQEELVEMRKVDQMPELPILVIQKQKDGELVSINDKSGKTVWLDPYELTLNKIKVVDLPPVIIKKICNDSKQKGVLGYGDMCKGK